VTSLVFPTYNPGPGVEDTWAAAVAFLRARPDPWEVLFVCDGCTDGTPARLARLWRETADRRLRVISYPANRGKGYAVRVGLLEARGAVRLFADVDLAYWFDDIARVAAQLHDGAAVVVGSRDHPDSLVQVPARHLGYVHRRRVQSVVFGAVVRRLLPLTVTDTQAGLKGMTAQVAERVVPNLTADGFGFDCELLAACGRYGIPVTEVPVCVRYADAASSTGGLRTAVGMLREVWRVRRRWPATGFPPLAPLSEQPAEPLARAA
jgi:glycosyltransferase involved in cell wall biosynthesis